MNVYTGIHLRGKPYVRKNGEALNPQRSLLVRAHSPDGFEWGYCGSGPAQLALAILLEECTEEDAVLHYQNFKMQHVAKWGDTWACTGDGIHGWLKVQPKRVEEQS